MSFPRFPRFPYTNFHRLNADWILLTMQSALDTVERIAADVDTWSSRILEAQTNASNALTTASSALTAANNAAQAASGAVRFDVEQTLTWANKERARNNIYAVSQDELSSATGLLSQTLNRRIDQLGIDAQYDVDDTIIISEGPEALYTKMDNALPPTIVTGAFGHGDTFMVYHITKLERSTVNNVYHYTVYVEGPTGSYVGNAVQGDSYITCAAPTP